MGTYLQNVSSVLDIPFSARMMATVHDLVIASWRLTIRQYMRNQKSLLAQARQF